MNGFTQVNLHLHSIYSDGALTPQALADGLAAAGVGYAALTDHNTLEGLPEFQEALRKRHIGFVPGVEVTAQYEGREIHLLGYGIVPNFPELRTTLRSLRQAQDLGIHSIAASMRNSGKGSPPDSESSQNAAPDGRLEVKDAIDLLHRAGGKVFLAHPFTLYTDLPALEAALTQLKSHELDGIEAFYTPYNSAQQSSLEALARKLGLLMCGGSDFHTLADPLNTTIPTAAWKPFRDAIVNGTNSANGPVEGHPSSGRSSEPVPIISHPRIYRRRYFVLRILLPTILAFALFALVIWGMILPSFESILLDRKRDLIRELANTAISILAGYERDERAGKLTRQEAQSLAIAQIETLRYGRESKDYFWLQDMHPRILMHPYRKDLNGQDVSGFTDPRGVPIFVEFADLVRRKGEGYINYVWQWKDDPQRLEAKESFIKGFEPWGWVIGTGIYIEDVKQEIARIESNLITVSLLISGGVILLLAFVVSQSLNIENQRREMEQSLHDSTDRYRSLVEATTEGTLLVLDGRCRYANPTLLRLLNIERPKLDLLDLADVLPREDSNAAVWTYIDQTGSSQEAGGYEGVLQRSDGSQVECVFALNPISSGGLSGFILLAKEIVAKTGAEGVSETFAKLAQASPQGFFRARAARRGVLVEVNETTRSFLAHTPLQEPGQPALADFFHNQDEFDDFMAHLLQKGVIDGYLLHLETIQAETITLSLEARLVPDAKGQPAWIDGMLQDVTGVQKDTAAKNTLIEKLQASLLFLHEPVGSLRRESLTCGMETPIQKVAALMTTRDASAVLVKSESGAVIGMVTDHDLRARVLASGRDLQTPVHRIMSAPLATIHEDALIYEALIQMEEQGVQYLAVEDKNGQIVGVIRSKELVQFHRYGSIILTREINRAASAEELQRTLQRAPALIQALIESGAKPRLITQLLSAFCDAATERLIRLAMTDLGEPPVEFVFIAMGSQGRQEQTLLTDQDNAIIYALPGNPSVQVAAAAYFTRLGEQVCAGLAGAGYTLCQGQVMASNPRWRADLETWKNYFGGWINASEPQELLEFSIFFDFRPVYGSAELAFQLRRHIHAELAGQPAFFPHLAQNSLLFKPPTRLPGKIYLGSDHAGQINLKDAMLPVVNFARLYALQHKLAQTNTLGRLDGLVERHALAAASWDEIASAYEFLMKLRLQRQLAAHQAGMALDNNLHPARLSHLEESMLQQAFAQISAVQKKITYDFLGGQE